MSRVRLQRSRYENKGFFKRYIYEHSGLFIIIFIIFLISFIIGSINAAFIEDELKAESKNYILNFVQYLETQEIDNKILLKESIEANLKPIIYIMLFGLVIIGTPLVLVYIGLYSYSIGYTVTSILASLGNSKGVLFILSMILPQEMVLLPTIFTVAISAILFSKVMLKINNRNLDVKSEILKYTLVFITAIIISLGVSFFETYVGSNLTQMIMKLATS